MNDHQDEIGSGEGWDISVQGLDQKIKTNSGVKNFRLIDVREEHEWEIAHIEGAQLIPLGTLAARMNELDSAQEIVLQCKSGARSGKALELLRGAGFRKIKNLKGGIVAWANQIDPSLPVY